MTDEELLARATEFDLLPYDPTERVSYMRLRSLKISRRKRINDTPRWAIVDEMNTCLNHDGEWEWEPSPSSRTDEFFARCRWSDLREAVAFVEDHLAKYPSGYKIPPKLRANPISMAEMIERRKKE